MAAIYMWLTGFSTRRAWVIALSDDPVTVQHLRDDVPMLTDDHGLAIGVLRRRMLAASGSPTGVE